MFFRRSFNIIIILFLALFLSSCSKNRSSVENGIIVFKNGSDKFDPAFQIKTRKLFEISNLDNDSISFKQEISTFTLDKDSNIYILDKKQSKILKYNKNGKFIKAFGQRGSGPGEFVISDYLTNILWMKNLLHVLIPARNEVKVFRDDGIFIKTIKTKPESMPFLIRAYDSNKIIGSSIMPDMGSQDLKLMNNLVLFDSLYNNLSTPYIYSFGVIDQSKPDALINLVPKFCLDKDNNIMLTEVKQSYYSVCVYDVKLKKIKEIRKSCIKKEFKPSELKRNRILDKELKGSNLLKYKSPVNGIFTDYKNRIWVAVPSDDENNLEINFNIFIDGVYQNNITLPLDLSNPDLFLQTDMKIIGNKIYVIDRDNIILKCYKIEN